MKAVYCPCSGGPSGAGRPSSGESGRCPSPAASPTARSTSTGSGPRASSWCSYAAAARGWSPGTWQGRRARGRGRPSWRRSRRPMWPSPTAGVGSPRPCARPGRAPVSRCASSTPSRRSRASRRRGRSSGRGASSTSSRATLWASRCCTGPSSGSSAISPGAGSVPTSWRTGPWWKAGGLHPREAEAGALVVVVAGVGWDPVHLPRPRPGQGRPAAVGQQHDRGRGELAAEGRPAQPPGLTSAKRAKAVFWWCRAHSGDARAARECAPRCRPTRTSTSCSAFTPLNRRVTTEGWSGATEPCGSTSATGTRTRGGWINGWKRMFCRDAHFVL